MDAMPQLQKAAQVLWFLTRIEPTNHYNIIPADLLLHLHKPQVYETNWATYFYQKIKKAHEKHNHHILHPMFMIPLIYHATAMKLDMTTYGLASRMRIELVELEADEPKSKKITPYIPVFGDGYAPVVCRL